MRRMAAVVLAGVLAVAACANDDDGASDGIALTSGAGAGASDGNDALLCARWAEFDSLLESDPEPSDDLVDELLRRQREIDDVLPEELAPAWDDITGWHAAFIEYFSTAGYQTVDEDAVVAVFGGEQEAEDAATAMEDGLTTMREWSALACVSGEGDVQAFCAAWADISALLGRMDQEGPTEESMDELFAAYAEASPIVPAAIRDDWNDVFAFAVPFRDVLVTVEYEPELVSDQLLVEAFGSVDAAEARELAADRSLAALDAWTLDGCGDFCSRWGETIEAIEMVGHDLGWVADMGDQGATQLDEMTTRLEVAGRQVPDAVRADWDLLTGVLGDWFVWWEELDFDRARAMGPQGIGPEGLEAAVVRAQEAAYLLEVLPEVWEVPEDDRDRFAADLLSGPGEDLAWAWISAVEHGISSTTERIDAWVEQSCDVEGGSPGRIRVVWPEIEDAVGSTIVLSVMPAGAVVADLGDVDTREAGFCESVGRNPWGVEVDPEGRRHRWPSEWFRSEPPEWSDAALCDFDWEAGPAVLEAGPRTLLVAMIPGGVRGRWLPAAPTACAALDVVVDGDTDVLLPPLRGCDADLADLVIASEPWQAREPVDPATPGAGTLRVTIPSFVLPEDIEGEHGGELSIVVLPAGTTLNDIGREQVWPSGGYRTHLGTRDDPFAAEVGAVALPIMEFPPTGLYGWLEPSWLAEASDDELSLAVLAPGEYDVHVEIVGHSHEAEDRRCGRTTVTIDGPTVIDLPDLGSCS